MTNVLTVHFQNYNVRGLSMTLYTIMKNVTVGLLAPWQENVMKIINEVWTEGLYEFVLIASCVEQHMVRPFILSGLNTIN